MSEFEVVKKERGMAGQPPDDKGASRSGDDSGRTPPRKARSRGGPREFKPAGSRGDDPITRNLKRVYEEVAAEPLPAELAALMKQLESKEGQ